jgi:large subunit ribosomal protein L17
MVTSLLEHERIYTTNAKAKELKRWADWMITLGKRGDLHARRQALQIIRDRGVVHKLFTDLAQRYQARSGGYTRTVRVGFRVGDSAPMSLIELMTGETQKKKKKRKVKKAVETAPARAEIEAEAEVAEPEQEEAVAEKVAEKKKRKKRKAAKKAEPASLTEEETVEPGPDTSEASEAEAETAAEEEAAQPAEKENNGKVRQGRKGTEDPE